MEKNWFAFAPPFLLRRFQFSNWITRAPQIQQKSSELSIIVEEIHRWVRNVL